MADHTSERYKTLSNGAVYDLENKRIVRGAMLTSDRARELVEIRESRRREIMREVANQAVENQAYKTQYGDSAWIAAIAEAAMRKATDPKDPKMIESARFLAEYMGESPQAEQASPSVPLSEVRGLLREIATAARELQTLRESES